MPSELLLKYFILEDNFYREKIDLISGLGTSTN